MRHRSDIPQELGGAGHLGCEGHLGVQGVWGCGASGGCRASGGSVCVSGTGQGAQDLHTCLMQKQGDVSATRGS